MCEVVTTATRPALSTHIGTATAQGIDLLGTLVVPSFPRKIIPTVNIRKKNPKVIIGNLVNPIIGANPERISRRPHILKIGILEENYQSGTPLETLGDT